MFRLTVGVAHPLLVRSRGTECLTGSCGVLARLSCLGISPACLTSSQYAESDWWSKAETGSVSILALLSKLPSKINNSKLYIFINSFATCVKSDVEQNQPISWYDFNEIEALFLLVDHFRHAIFADTHI